MYNAKFYLKKRSDYMSENITPEHYRAEISMLNHEIYNLTKQLEEKEYKYENNNKIDKFNPFSNPTEYHHYNPDYTEINPLIEQSGYEIPLDPDIRERKKIKKAYFAGGMSMLLNFLVTNIISYMMIYVIMTILQFKHPDASYKSLYDYAFRSSALISVTMITYLLTNVLFSLTGMKWSKTSFSSLIQTKAFNIGKAIKYCICAVFIQYVAAFFSLGISDIVDKYGHSIDVMDDSLMAKTTLGMVIMVLYSCIIAPITEELFYRGMLLKSLSKVNQRFGIIVSSLFFGLAHGNIRQFMLAFLLGIFLSHITMKHNSILPSTIVHIFVNSLATIINELSERITDEKILLAIEMVYILIAIMGIIFFIDFRNSDKLPATTPHQSRRGLAVAKYSITLIATFVIYIAFMILNILET